MLCDLYPGTHPMFNSAVQVSHLKTVFQCLYMLSYTWVQIHLFEMIKRHMVTSCVNLTCAKLFQPSRKVIQKPKPFYRPRKQGRRDNGDLDEHTHDRHSKRPHAHAAEQSQSIEMKLRARGCSHIWIRPGGNNQYLGQIPAAEYTTFRTGT